MSHFVGAGSSRRTAKMSPSMAAVGAFLVLRIYLSSPKASISHTARWKPGERATILLGVLRMVSTNGSTVRRLCKASDKVGTGWVLYICKGRNLSANAFDVCRDPMGLQAGKRPCDRSMCNDTNDHEHSDYRVRLDRMLLEGVGRLCAH